MRKTWIIIKREYFTRVRKRIFIITTILGPLLLASITVAPILLSKNIETEKIAVLDHSGLFNGKLENKNHLEFGYFDAPYDSLKKHYAERGFTGVLYIPENFSVEHPDNVEYYSEDQLGLGSEAGVMDEMNDVLRKIRLQNANISEQTLEQLDTPVEIKQVLQKTTDAGTATMLGYFMGFMIYIVLLLYGTQVMRGVMEEKTSRIAEVITSSVKPFQLMMGKIIGIALVGLTQFIIWISLVAIIQQVLTGFYAGDLQSVQQMQTMQGGMQQSMQNIPQIAQSLSDFNQLPLAFIAFSFIFFFLGGYLLYASIFAAIGAAAGDESDQSLTFIATLPVIISIIIMVSVLNQPNSQLAVISSMIPFCSPIIMAGRLPFNPPLIQVIASMALLIIGFILTTWFAAKIYRTGILMYGKKTSLKEMLKWVRYK